MSSAENGHNGPENDNDRQYVHKRLRRLDEHDLVEQLSHGLYRFKQWPDGHSDG